MDGISLMLCASLIAVDGDTVKCDGVNLRPMGDGAPYVSGFDTPEFGQHAKCTEEHRLAIRAMARMSELLQTPGLTIEDSGQLDPFKRPLVVLRLPDGSTIGQTLIDEGLARVWTPEYTADWCS
ncbi:MAG: thermonuclease family protein [Rhodobacteraceae bacterium]|nr:thermonuclease family protein [Paracoccaceae bacterium]